MCKQIFLLLISFGFPSVVSAVLRDPTLPDNLPIQQQQLGEQSNLPQPLTLSAIWISATSRHAIINGTRVKLGQILSDGSRVIKIQAHDVLVQNGTHTNKLFLVPTIKKNR